MNKSYSYIFPRIDQLPKGANAKYPMEQLFFGNFIQTNSVVYRWRFKDGLPTWFRDDLCPGDWYWHILHAETGRIGFMPEVMSVYRRHKNAIYIKTHISSLEHRKTFGLAELETYKAMNDHFKNKYFKDIASLANGVLADFTNISIQEGNDHLITKAYKRYPNFVNFFRRTLKNYKV